MLFLLFSFFTFCLSFNLYAPWSMWSNKSSNNEQGLASPTSDQKKKPNWFKNLFNKKSENQSLSDENYNKKIVDLSDFIERLKAFKEVATNSIDLINKKFPKKDKNKNLMELFDTALALKKDIEKRIDALNEILDKINFELKKLSKSKNSNEIRNSIDSLFAKVDENKEFEKQLRSRQSELTVKIADAIQIIDKTKRLNDLRGELTLKITDSVQENKKINLQKEKEAVEVNARKDQLLAIYNDKFNKVFKAIQVSINMSNTTLNKIKKPYDEITKAFLDELEENNKKLKNIKAEKENLFDKLNKIEKKSTLDSFEKDLNALYNTLLLISRKIYGIESGLGKKYSMPLA